MIIWPDRIHVWYIVWFMFKVNIGRYTIHGSYGEWILLYPMFWQMSACAFLDKSLRLFVEE